MSDHREHRIELGLAIMLVGVVVASIGRGIDKGVGDGMWVAGLLVMAVGAFVYISQS
jgi:hypothetical protein